MTEPERRVYVVLWNHADSVTGKCFPNRDTILRESGYKRSIFYEARKSLQDVGLITWKTGAWRTKGKAKPTFRVTYTLDFNHTCPRLQARARTSVETTTLVQDSREGPDKCIGMDVKTDPRFRPQRTLHLSKVLGEGSDKELLTHHKEKQAKRKTESSPPLKAGSAPPPLSEERARKFIEYQRQGFDVGKTVLLEAEEVLKKSHGGEDDKKQEPPEGGGSGA